MGIFDYKYNIEYFENYFGSYVDFQILCLIYLCIYLLVLAIISKKSWQRQGFKHPNLVIPNTMENKHRTRYLG